MSRKDAKAQRRSVRISSLRLGVFARHCLNNPMTEPVHPTDDAHTIDDATLPRASGAAAGLDVPGYELLGELGRGGMSVVYRARQRGLNRPVALKMILGGAHASPAALARFRGE